MTSEDPGGDVWLSFKDLKRAGIVENWQTLGAWQRDPRVNFPKGRLLGPNTRRWSKLEDIDPWLASRPECPRNAPQRSASKRTVRNGGVS